MNALYQASLSFTSQNIGAQKVKRIVPVLAQCLGCVVAVGVGLSALALLFGRQLLGIYSTDAQVIEFGMNRMSVVCLTYFLCGIMDVTCGSIRGLGYSVTPTIVSLAGACGLRILWILHSFRGGPDAVCPVPVLSDQLGRHLCRPPILLCPLFPPVEKRRFPQALCLCTGCPAAGPVLCRL